MKQLNSKHSVRVIVLFVCLLFSLSGSAQKKKISCIGDSITYGYDFSDPYNQSYPGQLRTLLGTTSWEVGNLGESSRSMLKGGGYSYWDSSLYTNALASNPDYIVLKLGTNDSKRWLWNSSSSNYKTDYKEMVQSFQNLSLKPEIWICLLIPSENVSWDIFKSDIKDKVNPKIKEIALEMGLNLIDLYAELDKNKPEWYLPDGVHPSVAGAGVIAQKVKEMLLMPKPVINYASGKVAAPDGDAYQWYKDGVAVASTDGGNLKAMPVTSIGVYKVSIKLISGNETRIVSKELNVSVLGTVDYKIKQKRVVVFPNPASTVVNVVLDDQSENVRYSISDLSGKTVLSGLINNSHNIININSLLAGIYMLKIGNETVKVIKGK